ncbi:MAG: hypothetical protein AAFV96_12845 [Pseudomonadota bacterium]
MGHIRIGSLPRSQTWKQVVEQIADGAAIAEIAGLSSKAANHALSQASHDPGLGEALWLLSTLPLAARAPGFDAALAELDLHLDGPLSLFSLTAAIADRLDAHALATGTRNDLGEMAGQALIETFTASIEPDLPSLFTPEPSEVRTALGRLASGDRFAALARQFFARLTYRTLDYYLSRELVNHVGPGRRFETDAERRAFDAALSLHCAEASRIVEAYAGGWFGKTIWQRGGLTRADTQKLGAYGLRKIRSELQRRAGTA